MEFGVPGVASYQETRPSMEGEPSPASMPGVRQAANVHRTFGPGSPHVDRNASRGNCAELPCKAFSQANSASIC